MTTHSSECTGAVLNYVSLIVTFVVATFLWYDFFDSSSSLQECVLFGRASVRQRLRCVTNISTDVRIYEKCVSYGKKTQVFGMNTCE